MSLFSTSFLGLFCSAVLQAIIRKKQILLKNLKIDEVFKKAIPEIQKFNLEYLSPKEFRDVFLFIEYKITLNSQAIQ